MIALHRRISPGRSRLTLLVLALVLALLPWRSRAQPPGSSQNNFVYEIFVRSFADGDNDARGIGDLRGVVNQLDRYLNDGDPNTDADLEVGVLWLMPIFPSPSYHGYDVTDYRDINPDYGTMSDFRHLIAAAHKRGVRVILDVPFNHTSEQHPWFREAIDNPSSTRRRFYPGFANGEIGAILSDSAEWIVFERVRASDRYLVLINRTLSGKDYRFHAAWFPQFRGADLIFWSDGHDRRWKDATADGQRIGDSVFVPAVGLVVIRQADDAFQ